MLQCRMPTAVIVAEQKMVPLLIVPGSSINPALLEGVPFFYMHDERPPPASLELADTEGIGETVRSPPPRQAFRMAERGKDVVYGGWDFTRCAECGHRLLRLGGL